jgi:hypothetical protein
MRPPPPGFDALAVGKGAEHLVCADLLLGGYHAFLADQGSPFDVVAVARGLLWRIQVKATLRPINANAGGRAPNLVYRFNVRRRGKGQRGERLSALHCDLVAFVGLDQRVVGYLPLAEVAQTVSLFPPGYTFAGKFKRNRFVSIEGLTFEGALDRCA